ncbi:aminomethyl-transferring glycine dehydrogenase subunit GcvPA [Paenibacillus sp. J5C_2022]|uniref:aminomethyl-transferring glycine dehydrogenase subunit GcvPA n=1 Tax=Paenibacillus sp. J5C2022 TaxID=2977129 RepID=UPI0021CFEB40|nr:aminomethyl-transferring glycine dehydrogenase subunit GcvPA [Paenibacillus sp. J5C2022]MCU6708400.1 aminomethyl-transferring glycine dehydrogenase subunit GcvPA [Paenibacillus sp. J5C2022]
MTRNNRASHPYIPNTVPEVQEAMLREIGISDVEELYVSIPQQLRLRKPMNLPPALAEYELQRHIERVTSRNVSSREAVSFLGGGCWQHFIPAVCDEIGQRSEFVTAYAGEPYEDHGRFQALFEYQSLMAELLDMDVVNVPTFDWAQAAATALRMAGRMTERKRVLIAGSVSADKLRIIVNYCHPQVEVQSIAFDGATGLMDLNDLETKLSPDVAAVYFENPGYMGMIEHQGRTIADMAHRAGAECVVGVDPSSLGVLAPPSAYGADIVCGDLQPLGIRMNYGGGQAGFIATRDEPRYVMEYPSRLFGIAPTSVDGEYGFGDVAYERTSFALREKGKESVGTQTALWGIVAGVYLALMGPYGMQELGTTIMQKSQYAANRLTAIPGVHMRFGASYFKEFVLDLNGTGMTVKTVNEQLLEAGIFGGKDLSEEFPELGQCALYCVTEVISQEEIDRLADALSAIIAQAAANGDKEA